MNQTIDVDFDYAEQYQKAYMKLLAARCHFMVTDGSTPDRESVDMAISTSRYSSELGYTECGEIKLQLKTDFQHKLSYDKKYLKYDLPIKNYRDLIGGHRGTPRYLFVMPLPRQKTQWTYELNNGIFATGICYWLNLKQCQPSNNEKTITVNIPLAQKVTLETLHIMLEKAMRGESL